MGALARVPALIPAELCRIRRRPGIRRSGRCRGFTLIELLVVIGILAALAGILFPVFGRVRENVRRTACLSHLQQLSRAHQLYLQEWDERFPDWHLQEHFTPPKPPRPPTPFWPHRYWTELLQPYLRCEAIFHDPSGLKRETRFGTWLADYALLTWMPDRSLSPNASGQWHDPHWRHPGPPMTVAQVVRPAETAALSDGWTTTRQISGRALRHLGGANVGFVDGHVRWLSAAQSWRRGTDGRGFYWLHYATADR